MLIADIKGKLTLKELISEDFLTSSVFSVFKYLDNKYLIEFLKKSKNIIDTPLSIELNNPKFEFWPWYASTHEKVGGAEPDLVINSKNYSIIIEAKNYSGKSGSGIIENLDLNNIKVPDYHVADQLAREYFIGLSKLSQKKIKDFVVIYLTRDTVIPKKEIKESIQAILEVSPKEKNKVENRIFWINWQQAYLIFDKIANNHTSDSFEVDICNDLVQYLEKRDLDTFGGFDFSDISEHLSDLLNTLTKKISYSHIIYHQRKTKYWKSLNLLQFKHTPSQNVFYSDIVNPYWDFRNFATNLKTTKSVFYDN